MGKFKDLMYNHMAIEGEWKPTDDDLFGMQRSEAHSRSEVIRDQVSDLIFRRKYYGDEVTMSQLEHLERELSRLLEVLE